MPLLVGQVYDKASSVSIPAEADLRAESNGLREEFSMDCCRISPNTHVVSVLRASAGPERGAAALIVSVRVRVRAAILCDEWSAGMSKVRDRNRNALK